MDAPKRIWAGEHGWYVTDGYMEPEYIHKDLVNQLIGYTVHDDDCSKMNHVDGPGKCTCGLSDKIREVRGE